MKGKNYVYRQAPKEREMLNCERGLFYYHLAIKHRLVVAVNAIDINARGKACPVYLKTGSCYGM
jgi:hypothetical protein